MSLVVNTKINPGFDNLSDDQSYDFYICSLDGEAYGYFAVAIENGSAVVHFYFKEFKLSTFKQALKDWEDVKESLKYHGVKKIISMNKVDSGSKWVRFLNIFGFSEPETIRISSMEM